MLRVGLAVDSSIKFGAQRCLVCSSKYVDGRDLSWGLTRYPKQAFEDGLLRNLRDCVRVSCVRLLILILEPTIDLLVFY